MGARHDEAQSESLGAPTPERRAKSSDWECRGIDATQELMRRSGSARAVTRARARTPIDLIDGAVTQPEREALVRFFVGSNLGQGRFSASSFDGVPMGRGSYSSSRVPFSEWERYEIGGRQYVWQTMGDKFRLSAEVFLRQCEHHQKAMTPTEWGRAISQSHDDRVGRGAAIATYRWLGWRLVELYDQWDRGQALADSVKSRIRALEDEEQRITAAVRALRDESADRRLPVGKNG